MIRTFLLAILIAFGWSSIELRAFMANALRRTANFVDPKESIENNPKHFQIPNPFYLKEKKDLDVKIDFCNDLNINENTPCFDRNGVVYRSIKDYKLTGNM